MIELNAEELERIAKDNPRVDLAELAENMRVTEELRRAGMKPPQSLLASPFERRRVVVTFPQADSKIVCSSNPAPEDQD